MNTTKQPDLEKEWELFAENLFCDWYPQHITLNTVKSMVKITYFSLKNNNARLEEENKELIKRVEKLERLIMQEGER